MMKIVVDLFYKKEESDNNYKGVASTNEATRNSNNSIEDQLLDNLLRLYDMNMGN